MKKSKTKHWILIILFVVIVYGFGGMTLLSNNKMKISEIENRQLVTFPILSEETLFDGSYFQDIINYYSDHFAQRERLLILSKKIESYKGSQGQDQVEIVLTSPEADLTPEVELGERVMHQEERQPIKTAYDLNQRVYNFAARDIERFTEIRPIEVESIDDDTLLEQLQVTDDETIEGERKNSLLIIEDTIYEIFGYTENACDYYASAINSFAEKFDEDMTIYSMVVPSHIEFLSSQKYRSLADSQADAINRINETFIESIVPINAYSILAKHSDEYIYFRSDHHWTGRGAYYAYTVFADKIGDNAYDLDRFEKTELEGFLGYLYYKNFNRNVKNNPDTVEIYHPFVENEYTVITQGNRRINLDVINMNYAKQSNKYMVFLSGDNPLSVIDTDLDNGRKILVFKDSYGNAFIPYLTSHYDEIHIIDPRHYKKGAVTYGKEHDIKEVLFLNSAVLISSNKGFANYIKSVSY